MYSRSLLSFRILFSIAAFSAACSYIFPLVVNVYFSSCQDECEKTKEAELALSRVKSKECRAKIKEEALCLRKQLLINFPESTCSAHNPYLINKYSGCFTDTSNKRVLQGSMYKSTNDSVCQSLCYRPGFLYYTYDGANCLCGNKIETAKAIGNETLEEQYLGEDKRNRTECLMVYHTGLMDGLIQPKQVYVDSKNISQSVTTVKILFLLQLNGRNARQVKRLIKALYSPKHLYVVHVDKRQNYMKQEMEKLADLLPNLHISNNSYSTIWGGASLLQMYLDVIRQALSMEEFPKWDYMINLSESDFPILSIEELEAQLAVNKGKTYLASHNYNTAQFIVRQGFEHFFVECDEHMWRIGRREEFPKNIRLDGGSDWLVLHRDLAEYSVSEEQLPKNLRKFFANVLLPLESFYHTLARNSRFCDTIINGNLKFTNWNRKQGCRCESLRKVVDWCGCSPLALKGPSPASVNLDNAINKSYYFARKFDSIVDIDSISFVEEQALRFRPEQKHKEHPSFSSAFINFYTRDVDGPAPHLELLAENFLSMQMKNFETIQLDSIDIFKANVTTVPQAVYTIHTPSNLIQLLVDRKNLYHIFPSATVDGYSLKGIQYGIDIDHKEEIFRDPLCYLNTKGTATVALHWRRLNGIKKAQSDDKTSPHVVLSWFNNKGIEVAVQNLKPYNSIYGTQFSSLDLSSLDNWLRSPGIWKARVRSGAQILAEVFFPVFDIHQSDLHINTVEKFFSVLDNCIGIDCKSKIWSTFYPDPKIDIVQL